MALTDRVRSFSRASALRQPMYRALATNQREPGEVQVLAPAMLAVAMADAAGIPLNDLLTIVENAKRDVDSPFAQQYRALVEYVRGELL